MGRMSSLDGWWVGVVVGFYDNRECVHFCDQNEDVQFYEICVLDRNYAGITQTKLSAHLPCQWVQK